MSLDNYAKYSQPHAEEIYTKLIEQCRVERAKRLGETRGAQIRDLHQFLYTRTNWRTAPASTKYHLCIEGGLLIHSVCVTETAIQLRDLLMPAIPIDSVILCGLMHDAGKLYGRMESDSNRVLPRYEFNILASGRQSDAAPYKYVEGGNAIPLTVKDLLVPLKFVDMSDSEMLAIMNADGQYVPCNEDLQHNETPLACIIHWADYWVGHVVEGQWDADRLSGIFGR